MMLLSLLAFLTFAQPVRADHFPANTKPLPDFALKNQNGKDVKLHDFKGKYVLASFVFTHCPMPNMCPLTLSLSKKLIEQHKALPAWKRSGFPLHILAVTLDPERDTPVVMKAQMEEKDLDPEYFTYVTGDPKVLSDLASEFNVIGIPGEGTISHNMKTELISPLMVPLYEWKDNVWTPEEILSKLEASVAWWKWFFLASALLAIPGVILVIRLRRLAHS